MRRLLLILLLLVAAPALAADPPLEGFVAADDGIRLFYRVEGSGPETLVVVHGGPGNSLESVRLDLEPLARNRRIIYYDQRGNGRSDLIDAPERLAIDHHIADLDAVRRHLGLERMNLLGNSWGGILVSAYAAAHPGRIERMILHAPAPPRLSDLGLMSAAIERRGAERLTLEQWRDYRRIADWRHWLSAPDPIATCRAFMAVIFRLYVYDPAATLPFRGDVCAGEREAVRRQQLTNMTIWRSLGGFDLRPGAARVTAPVLVVHGVADVVPQSGSEAWAASYPDARLLLMRRSGHMVHLEEPELFFTAVEQFLAGRWPEAARDLGPL